MNINAYFLSEKERNINETTERVNEIRRIDFYNFMTVEEKEELREKIFMYSIIDSMLERGYEPHIYNKCYGPFLTSKDIISRETNYLIKQYIGDIEEYSTEYNILLSRIIQYLGIRANTKDGNGIPGIIFVKSDFSDCINLKDFHGNGLSKLNVERLNVERYKIKRSEQILESNLSSDEKIDEIRKVYDGKNEDILGDITSSYEDAYYNFLYWNTIL